MKTYPFRLRKVFAEQAKEFGDEISAQQAAVKQSAANIAQAVSIWEKRVEALSNSLKATQASNTEVLSEIREIRLQIHQDAAIIRTSAENQKAPVTSDQVAQGLALQFIIPYAALFFVLGLLADSAWRVFWPH